MARPLIPILYENFSDLEPGRKLDRIIAENVLRFEWAGKIHLGKMAWERGGKLLFHADFNPSTDLNSAMQAITVFVDTYDNLSGLRIELSMIPHKHWKVSSTISIGSPEHLCSYSGDNLPFQICQCLVQTYLQCGPKDYETFNWLKRRQRGGS